jgi:YD repeat-containing protein
MKRRYASSNGLGFSYNAKNQTTAITGLFGTPLTTIAYADAGQAERTKTTSGGVDTVYANSSLGVSSTKVGAGAATYYTRTPSGHLIGQRTPGGATYYYLFDGLGSIVGMVDYNQNVVARYSYDPYGQTITKTGTAADGNLFRYTGAYLGRLLSAATRKTGGCTDIRGKPGTRHDGLAVRRSPSRRLPDGWRLPMKNAAPG